MIPFAVVGSDHEYQVNGKRILGRKTKWGTIEGSCLLVCGAPDRSAKQRRLCPCPHPHPQPASRRGSLGKRGASSHELIELGLLDPTPPGGEGRPGVQGSLYRVITQPYSARPVAVAAPPRRGRQPARLWNARGHPPWQLPGEAGRRVQRHVTFLGCPRRCWRWVQAGCLPRLPCRLHRLQLLPCPGVLTLEVSRGPLTSLSLSGRLCPGPALSWPLLSHLLSS